VPLLHPDEALALIENQTIEPRTERVPLEQALGRALAEEVLAPEDSPPFAKAAMDGFAVSSGDPGPSWRLAATLAAGDAPGRALARGECAKIMTGAMMPPGADKVIRVEYTREQDGVVTLLTEEPYTNVIPRGQNLRRGDRVLGPRLLAPQDVGVLASLGRTEVRVAVRPLVGVLATGSELRNPGETLGPGQIYNSNGLQACAQLSAAGARFRYYGIVRDEPSALRGAVGRALEECDLLLLSGGVSAGELDFVPGVLRDCGAQILFHKIAIKPGKPTLFARWERRLSAGSAGPPPAAAAGEAPRSGAGGPAYVFGLPGNPVSAFVIFELFVRPLLARLQGLHYAPRTVRARLAEGFQRRDTERVEMRPVRLERGEVRALEFHGSAHLNALSGADALLRIEAGVDHLEEGSWTDVRLL
jgi:molybdopterin molybdotransferase